MQLPLPLRRFARPAAPGRPKPPTVVPLVAGSHAVPLKLIRNRRARRYVLRVTDRGDIVVTLPRWGSVAEARAFAAQHLEWIATERLRREGEAAARAWSVGADIWLRGERHTIERNGGVVRAGDIRAAAPDGVSPAEALRAAIRRQARIELPARLLELAASADLSVARVSVRNQRSRWGSCSSRGSIALNWRLLLMPPDVRDYVLWHELMHLKRGDHSPAFWKLVEGVCPGYRDARAWLRAHGRDL